MEGKNWVKPLLCLRAMFGLVQSSVDNRKFLCFRTSSEVFVNLTGQVWDLIHKKPAMFVSKKS